MNIVLDDEGLPEINPSRRYSVKEAAHLLGVTTSTMYQWRADNKGPRCIQPVKYGRIQYAGSWLQEFLRNHIREPVE